MAFCKVLFVLLVLAVSTLASFYDRLLQEEDRDFGDNEERELAMELRTLRERESRVFECKKLSEGCRGVVPCCESLQCYWKDGYSASTPGVCVQCIQRDQKCQRDSSCCSGLVCQKGGALHTDGYCQSPRATGGACHEDDQCASHNCRISVWDRLKFKEGVCA